MSKRVDAKSSPAAGSVGARTSAEATTTRAILAIVKKRQRPSTKKRPQRLKRSEIPADLRAMARAGLIRLGSGKLPKGFWKMPRPADPSGAVLRALREERESGW